MIALSKQKAPLAANCARCNAPLGVPIGAYAHGQCTSCGATYKMVGGAGPHLTNMLAMLPVMAGIAAGAIWPPVSSPVNFWTAMTIVVLAAVGGQVVLWQLNKNRRAEWSFE